MGYEEEEEEGKKVRRGCFVSLSQPPTEAGEQEQERDHISRGSQKEDSVRVVFSYTEEN